MITQASRLHARLQMAALAANVAGFAVLALLAPGILLLEPEVAFAGLVESGWIYPLVLGLAAIGTAVRIRRLPALRLLEQEAVDLPADPSLARKLHGLPLSWVTQLALQATAVNALTMIPLLRPSLVDLETQAALVLMATTVTLATSLPLYVIARAIVGRAIEAISPRVVEEAIRQRDDESMELRRSRIRDPFARVTGRLVLAVALPVALVALGAALIAHAHVRAYEARHRQDDAYALARGVLEPEPNAGTTGRVGAIAAAAELGFEVKIEASEDRNAPTQAWTGPNGVRALRTRLEDAEATVDFSPSAGRSDRFAYGIGALVAFVVAALVGRAIGRAVARDLRSATREVRLLGTQDVLRGVTRVAGPARFAAVAALGSGVEEVAERFREFARGRQRMIEAREAAQKMRDLFLASMSHDLRSPLNGILGFVELLQKGEHMSSTQHESLVIIERRGRELLELIENILDAAKIEAGRLELTRDWTSPGDVLGEIVRRGRELAEEKGGKVELGGEMQTGMPPMWIDGPRLEKAVVNLVGNAVKFVDRGILVVRFSQRNDAGQRRLRVDVEDRSRGIPERDLAQIYDAFRQGIRSRRHGGLGLGLSMTRAIVELHGGRIEVESTVDRGSVFTMWIPLPAPGSVFQGERVPVSARPSVMRLTSPEPPMPPPMKQPKKDEQDWPTVEMPPLDIPLGEDEPLPLSSPRMQIARPRASDDEDRSRR